MNRTLVYLAALSVAACGGSGSGTGGAGTGGAGTESPSPASTVYQTAQGFCASVPKLSGGDLTNEGRRRDPHPKEDRPSHSTKGTSH
jgi:hypothetical protein